MTTEIQDDTRTLRNGNLCPISYDAIIAACKGGHFPMSLVGRDAEVVVKAVNRGIDSRLQACYLPSRGDDYGQGERSITATEDSEFWNEGDKLVLAHTLECSVSPESLPVLLRRLFEDLEWCESEDCDGEDCDGSAGHSLAESILMTLGFNDSGQFVGREALGLE